jgi:hypothetical protein
MYRSLLAFLLALTMSMVAVPVFAQEGDLLQADQAAPSAASAQAAAADDSDEIDLGIEEVGDILKLSDEDPRVIATRIINGALGFLAIITVLMILFGGFQFLLSGGQEDKTAAAGATIRNAIIGLIIILSSWAAVHYILEQLVAVTTAS